MNILEQLIYIRAGEVSTVLVKEEQLDLLELLERLDPGVGEGNLEVEDKKGRKARDILHKWCWDCGYFGAYKE